MKTNLTLENPIYFGTEISIIDKANALRKDMTNAEKVLWAKLRRRQLCGYRFRRQHPINRFIADFYCHEKRLVIEVDGGYHAEITQTERDQQRSLELENMGIKVLRFNNVEVLENIEEVLNRIREFLMS